MSPGENIFLFEVPSWCYRLEQCVLNLDFPEWSHNCEKSRVDKIVFNIGLIFISYCSVYNSCYATTTDQEIGEKQQCFVGNDSINMFPPQRMHTQQ
jgi:hypothetical protein